jgi:metal-dependent amidase/aminoacylase/carboxypeptidase family protein
MEAKSSPMWHGKQQNLQVLKKELLRTTGLGVYCQSQTTQTQFRGEDAHSASTAKALSPLQAEASALLATRNPEQSKLKGLPSLLII